MKNGIDVKVIKGNIGLPNRESLGETKWRKAKPGFHSLDAFREFYMEKLFITEDIDYIEVTDEEIQIGWDKLQKQLNP